MGIRVTAILAAYNEEDIVGSVIAHLVEQGVDVYFIDHGSSDRTLEEARRFEGKGVIGLEQLPAGETVRWESVLRRKEELARSLPGDWFIHHDADEFRESPWPELRLSEAIRRVDALGFNAIDFEVLQFRPTHDGFRKGDDPLTAFPFYEPCLECDRLQIKCWKKAADVEIADSGGHDVRFPGRKVFPVRFLLRHYPIRTQAQGSRKLFRERLPRFDPAERARGWHRQYEGAREDESVLRSSEGLRRFDPELDRMRLFIDHRGIDELRSELAQSRLDLEPLRQDCLRLEADLKTARAEADAARARLRGKDELETAFQSAQHELQSLRETVRHLENLSEAQRSRIDDLLASWSWRSTAGMRALLRRLRGY